MNPNPHDWIYPAIEMARKFYGIDPAWFIETVIAENPGGREDTVGGCEADSTYLNARLEFKDGLGADNFGQRAVLHEVGHIALAEVDDAIQSLVTAYIPDEKERIAWLIVLDRAIERFLQRLVRAQIPLARQGEMTQDEATS